MKQRTRLRFVSLGSVLLAVMCGFTWLGYRACRKSVPTYQGKTVDQWFYGDEHRCGLDTTIEKATVAFNEMGTNCLPFLLQNLRRRETGLATWYDHIFPRLPIWLQSRLRPAESVGYIKQVTVLHLSFLQPHLKSVAADLMDIVPRIRDAQARDHAFRVVLPLAREPAARDRSRELLRSMLKDSEFRIQLEAAIALADVDAGLTNGVPVLLNAVTNAALVASQSVLRLWPNGPPVPMPRGVSATPGRHYQQKALDALRTVAPWLTVPTTQSPPGDRVGEGGPLSSGQQDGPANGSQPVRSATNRTSAAAGSRR